jgi:hypothetical protein
MGARQAQQRLQEAFAGADGRTAGRVLVDAGLFGPAEAAELTEKPDTGSCQAMADLVVERARAARAAEPLEWP